jgi:hypothetical protein
LSQEADALDSCNPDAVDARKNFWDGRFSGSALIVERAIERGELPVGTDPQSFVEFLVAPAYLRLLLLDRPLDDGLLEHSVRITIAAYGDHAVGRQYP